MSIFTVKLLVNKQYFDLKNCLFPNLMGNFYNFMYKLKKLLNFDYTEYEDFDINDLYILIQTNNEAEAIKYTIQYLTDNKIGLISYHEFQLRVNNSEYTIIEEDFVDSIDPYDFDEYVINELYIDFLVDQVSNINSLKDICKKYGDTKYNDANGWYIYVEFNKLKN